MTLWLTAMDSLILCKFLRGVFEDFYAEAADMSTSWQKGTSSRPASATPRPAYRPVNLISSLVKISETDMHQRTPTENSASLPLFSVRE